MTEKRFSVMSSYLGLYTIFDEKQGKPLDDREIIELLEQLPIEKDTIQKQNQELKQLLKQQSEGFRCTIEENYTEFNKDKIYIEDNNTQINLKNGKIDITIYIPQINNIKRFSYFITGKTITERYLEDLKEHNKKIIDKELKK